VRDELGAARSQYLDLERIATTPERFLRTLIAHSPFVPQTGDLPAKPASPAAAFGEALWFLATARARDGGPATFLLDEVLEVRTFESFPGLRTALADLLKTIDGSANRFLLATRWTTRGARLANLGSARLRPWPVEPVTADGVRALLDDEYRGVASLGESDDLGRTVHALTGGRAAYVRLLLHAMKAMSEDGGCDPISALSAVLVPGGRLDVACRFSYERRLHRARGHGALRAILEFLAEEQPLNLTAIARRMQRTPGSTKDYLTWLEDVDLVRCDRKRYSFVDPVLGVWIRLNGRPAPPGEEDVAREVHRFALERLAGVEPLVRQPATAAAPVARPSGLIEID
jgi:hypothetical protein